MSKLRWSWLPMALLVGLTAVGCGGRRHDDDYEPPKEEAASATIPFFA